jgi:RNA polymerase sigma-70 factor (ECF subfamily)
MAHEDEDDALELLARFRQGDQYAADALFHRYVGRLTALAQKRLSERLARRVDADDIVQSAYRSFFLHARDGAYTLQESGDMWRLLVAITLNKLRRQVERNTAGKRAMSHEQHFDADGSVALRPEAVASDPTPEEALSVVEEVEALMEGLTPIQCQMLELRLQGHTVDEIAEQVNRSERGVRRLLDKVKEKLHQRLADSTRA